MAMHPDNDAHQPARNGRQPGPALDKLASELYDELREIARHQMGMERQGHTFQPTALVHEAFLRLGKERKEVGDRTAFIALASQMMRRILVDHARAKYADKRGGDRQRLTITTVEPEDTSQQLDLLALDDALNRLAEISSKQARIVELRFFGGMNVEETARVLDMGKRSVDREWACAKAWLFRELGG